ncbi:MAG: hypothetical protein DI598_17690 [Pseudopedobacter saltans]|uniref:Uncharacterized protein n=1 Tax=Pseudopedobacter saltans TaxID=151895 RepID=A0A2W5EKX2_9SPHI|nr:MAG: hypothetical protein DI598_17690 [Pseudopedobacter saltans]
MAQHNLFKKISKYFAIRKLSIILQPELFIQNLKHEAMLKIQYTAMRLPLMATVLRGCVHS